MDPRLVRLAELQQQQRMRPDATSTAGLFRPKRDEAPALPGWLQAAELGADIVTPGPLGAGTTLHGLYNMARGYPEEGAEMIGADLALGLTTGGVGNRLAKARKLKKVAEVLAEGGDDAKAAAKAAKEAEAARAMRIARQVNRTPLTEGPILPDEAVTRIPGAGLFRKPKDGAKKTDPMPDRKLIQERQAKADAAMRFLEANAGEPWTPNPRGILDRTGFDPNFRLVPNTNTMIPATGRIDPLLAEALDNKQLRNLMERQVNLGLRLGGEGFYNLKPLADAYEETSGPVTFRDWVNASSAGSIQAPLPQEMANASILLFARQNDLPYDKAVEELLRRYPMSQRPWFSGTHMDKFDEYLQTGSINPDGPASGARKVPYYSRQKLGESMTPEQLRMADNPMGSVVDTHESKAVLWPVGMERYVDNMTGAQYEQVADLYRVLAQRLGIPVETVQAGRWLGGGPLTGLKSPRGDYVQGFEDALYKSAVRTNKDLSPAALRRYRNDVLQGRDFILPDYGKN